MITRLLEERTTRPYKNVKLAEFMNGMSFDCWKHLYDHGASLAGCTATKAAEAGNLQCLRFVHQTKAKVSKQCMTTAIQNGHLDCARFIHEVGNVAITAEHAAIAACRGDLVCLTYLFEHGCPNAGKICAAAATCDSLECLKYAHEQGCPMTKSAMMSTKSLDCIKYMRAHGVQWSSEIYEWALYQQRMDCLQYFYDEGLAPKGEYFPNIACAGGGGCLRWLYEHGIEVEENVVLQCILPADLLTCLKIVVEFGYRPTQADCAAAASCGRDKMQCLQYLHEELKCPWDASACTAAARAGSQQVLRFLLDRGCPCDADTFAAGTSKHRDTALDCAKLLHAAGCPWDARATESCTLETLQYLHEHGCPWDERTTTAAAVYDAMDVLMFAHAQGCPTRKDIIAHVVHQSYRDMLPMVQYLHTQGCTLDAAVSVAAARRGRLEVLKYVQKHGCPLTLDAYIGAIRGSYDSADHTLPCIRYLHDNGCPWDVTVTNTAVRMGNLQILTYLREHGCPCDVSTCAAAAAGAAHRLDISILQYLHEQGVPWDETTCTAAAYGGYLPSLVYAHTHGCPWDHHTYEKADFYVSCMAYLQQNGCPRTEAETAALHAQQAAVASTPAAGTAVAVADGATGASHTESASASEPEDESPASPSKRQKQVHEVGATTGSSSTSIAVETVGPSAAVSTLAGSHITAQEVEVEEEPGEMEA